MPGTRRRFLAFALAISLASVPLLGDDKDLLKGSTIAASPNLYIVFGNSQTMTQTLTFTGANFSTFDGDADSPGSKLGAGKRVIKDFLAVRHTTFNVGMTAFSRPPNFGSTSINREHWIYQAAAVDFPSETWKEPVGTMERWGVNGEGPCTTKTVPVCTDRSPGIITLGSNVAAPVGPFFGTNGTGQAFIYLNGTNVNNASQRIRLTMTSGKYGDAFTDGTFATYTLGGTPPRSVQVTKEFQTKSGSTWTTQATTPNNNPGTVVVPYVALGSPIPSGSGSADPTLFYPTGATNSNAVSIAGRSVGFLNEPASDFTMNTNCSGLEFQNTGHPLIKIPRDYSVPDPNNPNVCLPALDSYNCVKRLLRPQAYIENWDVSTGFTTNDPDNPGYTHAGSKYADGCDPSLMGTVQDGLDSVERQVILTAKNGSQAPIKGALQNILDYFTDPKIDGFKNGVRGDDPNASCRNGAVILIYDNFTGCQNDNCGFLTSKFLTTFKQLGIPIYVIGFGANAAATASTGVCIAQNSGAILPDGTVGYFPVTTPLQLAEALNNIADFVLESQKGFVAASVSTAQLAGEQMVYLATFNAASQRSIWDGRVNGYRLDPNGKLQIGVHTIRDTNDPFNNVAAVVPSNAPSSLKWNVGQNLAQTDGTGATNPSAVLAPNAAMLADGTYQDNSNDTASTIATHRYPGRKIVFSLPENYADPVTLLPIPPGISSPEIRYDLTATTGASWWPALKALLGPQIDHPGVPSPIGDTDAAESLRFIWGDRDAVMALPASAKVTQKYTPAAGSQLKLGDIFHSTPILVAAPNEFAYYSSNLNGYQTFRDTYHRRRRVLYFGANDGLFHAVDAGGWNRTLTECVNPDGTQGSCYDSGTGAELFAYAPRATMQQYKMLKDAEGPQTKRDEWTVDGSPTAADVFVDTVNTGGLATPGERAWHTVIVGGVREGSPFEGTSGAAPAASLGSYYAIDVTQPDQLVPDGAGGFTAPIPTSFNAPKCLNASGDTSCPRDWPQVLWEITDVGDLDASGAPGFGYGDMGETWSKPAVGRVRVCTANCGNTTTPLPVTEDRFVAVVGGGFDRERLNRRGNWLYMIDIETGHVLYRANSSCGINTGAGCSPTYFASIPSEPAALDPSGDGYLDLIYFADQKGQLWRIDLSDLRMGSAASRWHSQIDPSLGSATPFLVFQAPQPTAPAIDPNYPVYYRPTAVYLGYNVGGRPALGLAFGTGDRDDILSKTYTGALNFKQRFYYVVDKANTSTRFESDLLDIASPTAPSVTDAPANGWFLELVKGERIIADSISINGVIFFTTFNPNASITGPNTCGNPAKCALGPGTARLYRVLYSTGNPYSGSDRGETQTQGGFLSEPVYFQSKDQQGNIFYTTENSVKTENAPGGKRTSVKGWKERSRRP